MPIAASFTAVGVSAASLLRIGQRAVYSITGTYVGTVVLQRLLKGAGGPTIQMKNILGADVSITSDNLSGVVQNDTGRDIWLQFNCTAYTSGTVVPVLTDIPNITEVTDSVGTPSGTGVTVSEDGGRTLHKTTLFFENMPLTLLDATVGASKKIYTFPEGRIALLGAVGAVSMITTSVLASTLNAGITANWGLGSTAQANGTLATTEQDMIPTTALTASATINVAGAVSKGKLAAAAQFDGTTTPEPMYFNVGIATATDIDGDATVLVNGYVTFTWINLGDY